MSGRRNRDQSGRSDCSRARVKPGRARRIACALCVAAAGAIPAHGDVFDWETHDWSPTGTGTQTFTNVDGSGVNVTFCVPVYNLVFTIEDIDSRSWFLGYQQYRDSLHDIYAQHGSNTHSGDAEHVSASPTYVISGDQTAGLTLTAYAPSGTTYESTGSDTRGDATVGFGSNDISSFYYRFSNASIGWLTTGDSWTGLGTLEFDAVPEPSMFIGGAPFVGLVIGCGHRRLTQAPPQRSPALICFIRDPQRAASRREVSRGGGRDRAPQLPTAQQLAQTDRDRRTRYYPPRLRSPACTGRLRPSQATGRAVRGVRGCVLPGRACRTRPRKRCRAGTCGARCR